MEAVMFKLYGTGQKGRKADDLEQYSGMITSLGMKIPAGVVLLADLFIELMKVLNLTEDSHEDALLYADCPDFLKEINLNILKEMKIGSAYAIRSSALSERGGTGIYQTTFFARSGDEKKDLDYLWGRERAVYASEFSASARVWRKKCDAPIGMAILIQEVHGYRFENHLLPSLAGVAYTSFQGLPTVRVVVGLGTKAVNGEGVVYNTPPDHPLHFARELWDQEAANTIDLTEQFIGEVDTHHEEVACSVNFKVFCSLFEKLSLLKKQGEFSIEWAIADDDIYVVQCAPYEDRLPGDMAIDKNQFFLLAQGSDVLHSGRSACKGVVLVRKWSSQAASMLKVLNERMSKYLLIVSQDAFTLLAGIGIDPETHEQKTRLAFCHFSNASAVVEMQWHYSSETIMGAHMVGIPLADHTGGKGASHFQQLCSRTDILYLGAGFDLSPLIALPGRMDYNGGIQVWETESVVLVDGAKKEGFVYVSKQATNHRYSPEQISEWSHALRQAANTMSEESGKKTDLAGHFYWVHYAIGNDDSPMGFDPFALDPQIMEKRGKPKMIESTKVVLSNIDRVDLQNGDTEELKDYLKKLLIRLQK